VVHKKFGFADKHRLPFVFVSASDGSNVVKVFNMAVQAGLRWRAAPKEDFYQEVGDQMRLACWGL
jgi:Rab-like protein 2